MYCYDASYELAVFAAHPDRFRLVHLGLPQSHQATAPASRSPICRSSSPWRNMTMSR
jgi:hypothetical protein